MVVLEGSEVNRHRDKPPLVAPVFSLILKTATSAMLEADMFYA